MLVAILVNLATLLIGIFAIPKFAINSLIVHFSGKKGLLSASFLFIAFVIFFMLYQIKLIGKIQVGVFAFSIPLVLLTIKIIGEWLKFQGEANELEEEIETQKKFQESYDELLEKVRMRQHDFNNQLTGILSTHYTYNTYDEIVKVQQNYCQDLKEDNRYNKILWLDNKVLAGFLYRSFLEMEAKGITVDYSIKNYKLDINIFDYQLVDMLGVLLENAVEAVENIELSKEVKFEIEESEKSYSFKVSNQCKNMNYSQIEEWFLLGKSSKGNGRGIGLYKLKQLCEKQSCEILCGKIEHHGKNWIQFVLKIMKEGEHF